MVTFGEQSIGLARTVYIYASYMTINLVIPCPKYRIYTDLHVYIIIYKWFWTSLAVICELTQDLWCSEGYLAAHHSGSSHQWGWPEMQ